MSILQCRASAVARSTLALGALVGLLGCRTDRETVSESNGDLETIERINEDPTTFAGKSVVVAGEVEDVYGNRAFTLGGNDFFDHEILVLSREPVGAAKLRSTQEPLWRDDIVQASGKVRMFVTADIERELGWDLDPQIEAAFSSRPVLLADRVTISPRRGGQAPADPGAASREGRETTREGQRKPAPDGASRDAPMTDFVAIITVDPASLIDRKVELSDVPVRSVVSDRGFWVGPSHGRQMFIRLDPEPRTPNTPYDGRVDIEAGDTLDIKGTIKALPEGDAVRQKWGLDPVQADLLADEPFYVVAESVTPKKKKS